MNDAHGGNIYNKAVIYDFSANINPLGMPESVRRAYHSALALCTQYPDHACTELRREIAASEGCTEHAVCIGNGAADLIFRIVHTFKPRKAVLVSPSFSEYEKALTEIGCSISFYPLHEKEDFILQPDFLSMVEDCTDLLFLTSPNNPTGKLIPPELLQAISEKCLASDTLLVVDECFMDFVENGSGFSAMHYLNANTILLKAFTKMYAMPGIRIGYAICGDTGKAERIMESGQFWSVSTVAQVCGIAAVRDSAYRQITRQAIRTERAYLETALSELGIQVYHSHANFILFRTERNLYDALLRMGILVRCCGNYRGLSEQYYRIAVKGHSENLELIKALEVLIHGKTNHDTGNNVECR